MDVLDGLDAIFAELLLFSDLALMHLTKPIPLNKENRQKICLPSLKEEPKLGDHVDISGWGKTEVGLYQ